MNPFKAAILDAEAQLQQEQAEAAERDRREREVYRQRVETHIPLAKQWLEYEFPALVKEAALAHAKRYNARAEDMWIPTHVCPYPEESVLRAVELYFAEFLRIQQRYIPPDKGTPTEGDFGHDGYTQYYIEVRN